MADDVLARIARSTLRNGERGSGAPGYTWGSVLGPMPGPASKAVRSGCEAHPILELQRSLGNQRVAALIRAKRLTAEGRILPLQAKLMVGAVDDPHEREAEGASERVVRMPDAALGRGAHGARGGSEEGGGLAAAVSPMGQRDARRGGLDGGSFEAGAGVEAQVSQSKGRGAPLPESVRAFMEPRFGADFAEVRVHTGSESIQMNEAVGARAFTHGADIYFGAGESAADQKLVAHELTHVLQQTGAVQAAGVQAAGVQAAGVQRDLAVTPPVANPTLVTLTAAQIAAAISYNQAHFTDAAEIANLRDIVGIHRDPAVIDEDFIRAVASYQASNREVQDGKIGAHSKILLGHEIIAEASTMGPGKPGNLQPEFQLKEDLQKLIDAGNRNYADYKAQIIAATPIQQTVARLDATFVAALKGLLSWNDFARCMELLGLSAPGFGELVANGLVQAALHAAWVASNVAVPAAGTTQHEEGGWVFMNLMTGDLTTQRAVHGAGAAILLTSPPTVTDSIVVAKFHTHPNLGPLWESGPSPQDATVDAAQGVPDIVAGNPGLDPAVFQTFASGPDRRQHLGGNRGLPGAGGGIAPQAKADGTHDEQ